MQSNHSELNSNIKELINSSEYIFFDIFDTLVTRPFTSPKGIFSFIEYTYKQTGFYSARIDAERLAREINEETTLDEIYNHIHPIYRNLKNIEKQIEIDLCYKIESSQNIYKYCLQNNKKVFFVSDMYLDEETILQILNKNNYKATVENLFLSSQIKYTKRTGSLYDFIINKLQITSPSCILMIGDNYDSDVKIPNKKGMKSFHIKTPKHQGKYYFSLYDNLPHQSTLSSLLKIISEYESKTSNYWYEIGYNIAGPIVYSYSRFILNIITDYHKKSPKILFVGRDGYLLNKAFSLLHVKNEHEYVYAPRTLMSSLKTSDKLSCGNQKDIFQAGIENLQIFRSYISNFIKKDDELFVVDSRTASFSAQRLIQIATGKTITGIYWEVNAEHEKKTIFPHYEFKNSNASIKCWPLFEFLITSPEPPVKALSRLSSPIYHYSPYEKTRTKLFAQIEMGCLDFLRNFVSHFPPDKYPIISYNSIVTLINHFLTHPSKRDIEEFRNALIAVDENHTNYTPFLSTKFSPKNFRHYISNLSRCSWRTPLQNIIINVAHPLQIRTNAIRKTLTISFLPKLNHSIILIKLSLFDFCLEIKIGNSN